MNRKLTWGLLAICALTLTACSLFTGQPGDPVVETLGGLVKNGTITVEQFDAILAAYRDMLATKGDPWYVPLLSHAATILGTFLGIKLLPDKLILKAATLAKIEGRG